MIWVVMSLVVMGAVLLGFIGGQRSAVFTLVRMAREHERFCPARLCASEAHCACATPPTYVTAIRRSHQEHEDYVRKHRET